MRRRDEESKVFRKVFYNSENVQMLVYKKKTTLLKVKVLIQHQKLLLLFATRWELLMSPTPHCTSQTNRMSDQSVVQLVRTVLAALPLLPSL